MARVFCTRRIEFDAAHRVLRHESKCSSLHGHRYFVEIQVSAPGLDSVGRVVDFGVLKKVIGGWIDEHWDHTTLVNYEDTLLRAFCDAEFAKGKKAPFYFDGEPTAENMVAFLAEQSTTLLARVAPTLMVEHIRLYETPNCWSDWFRT